MDDEDEPAGEPMVDGDDGLTTDNESEYGSDSELPRVQLDELLDDMDEMAIEEQE